MLGVATEKWHAVLEGRKEGGGEGGKAAGVRKTDGGTTENREKCQRNAESRQGHETRKKRENAISPTYTHACTALSPGRHTTASTFLLS